jgi:deoxyribonuclease-4
MLLIGTHLSSARGFLRMGQDALSIGAATFQFFPRNPRGTKAKLLNLEDLNSLKQLMKEHAFGPIISHAPYTMNPCSTDSHIRELAGEMFVQDLSMLEHLPGNYYNLHPGSHLGQGPSKASIYISDMLNYSLSPGQKTMVLLETMSGKGTEVGRSFEELKLILEKIELKEKIGICFDACHLSDAGYDIIDDLDGVLSDFDTVIGLDKLHAFHINDSQNPPGSRKDRHALLGDGFLGTKTIIQIINHPKLRHLPFILETPTDLEGHKEEIEMLKRMFRNDIEMNTDG